MKNNFLTGVTIAGTVAGIDSFVVAQVALEIINITKSLTKGGHHEKNRSFINFAEFRFFRLFGKHHAGG